LRAKAFNVLVGLGVIAAASCSAPRAGLVIDLQGTPTVTPLVFHGNCLAGFMLSYDLRVRETEGGQADLRLLRHALYDDATGEALGGETLDASALRERYGAESMRLPPHGVQVFALGVRIGGPGRRTLVGEGEVEAADEAGPVRRTYRLSLGVVTIEEPKPSAGGACPPAEGR
jgi:hypothetical protein